MYWSHLNDFWTEFILWFMYVSLHIKIRLLFSYLVSYSVIFVNEILDICWNYSFQSHLPFDEMWCVKIICVVHSVVSHSLQPQGLQHARLPCPSVCPRVCSNSYPLSQWCHPTTSSSAAPFSFRPQSFPASGSEALELHLQHQSFQWIFRVDFLSDWLVWSPCCPRDSQEPSLHLESINKNHNATLIIALLRHTFHNTEQNIFYLMSCQLDL